MYGVIIGCISFICGSGITIAIISHECSQANKALKPNIHTGNAHIRTHSYIPNVASLIETLNEILNASQTSAQRERKIRLSEMKHMSELSHDIRTPLAGASGHLQLIDPEKPLTSPENSHHIQASLKEINATSQILDEMLELTRAQDPDRTYHIEHVELLPLLLQVLDNHEQAIIKKHMEPQINFTDESIHVQADTKALTRVIENLLINALRYGHAPFTISQRRARGRISLSISNAIDHPETIDTSKIFERFTRADPSRNRRGTGLGLPIAYALSKRMGIKLTVTKSDKAITFTLTWE